MLYRFMELTKTEALRGAAIGDAATLTFSLAAVLHYINSACQCCITYKTQGKSPLSSKFGLQIIFLLANCCFLPHQQFPIASPLEILG